MRDIFNRRPSIAAASVAHARLIMFRDAEPAAAMIRITLLHRQTMQMDGKTPRLAPNPKCLPLLKWLYAGDLQRLMVFFHRGYGVPTEGKCK